MTQTAATAREDLIALVALAPASAEFAQARNAMRTAWLKLDASAGNSLANGYAYMSGTTETHLRWACEAFNRGDMEGVAVSLSRALGVISTPQRGGEPVVTQ